MSAPRLRAISATIGAPAALEGERPGHNAHGEGAELARDLRDDRRAARAGATTLARSDEDHVRALQRLLDLVPAFLGRLAADLGIRAGAQSARRGGPDMELHVRVAHEQRLRIRVHGEELHALEACIDHPVDGVRAAAADADDFDHC